MDTNQSPAPAAEPQAPQRQPTPRTNRKRKPHPPSSAPEGPALPVRREGPKRPKNLSWGVTWMLFRAAVAVSVASQMPAQPIRWERCGHDVEHSPDSAVHRYQREIRFLRPDNEEELADARIREARDQIQQGGVGQIKTHAKRVQNFALFERYVLT